MYVCARLYVCMPYTGLFHRFLQEERGIFCVCVCVFKVNRVVNIYIYRLVESFHTSCIVEKEVAVLRTEISRVIFGY
jgi:hypothetical protein